MLEWAASSYSSKISSVLKEFRFTVIKNGNFVDTHLVLPLKRNSL
jgi:hypothetical protein